MPISGIILLIVGVVLLITVHWAAGAACILGGLILVGYAMSQRGAKPAA